MSTVREHLGRELFKGIMAQAKTLSFGELIVLKTFYANEKDFDSLPEALKEKCMTIATAVADAWERY